MTATVSAGQLAEAVEQFVTGRDEERFAVLFRLLAPQLLVYFRVRGCEAGVAEDLTQEVMITLYRKVDGLRERELFRPWLFRIARNVLLQHVRKQGQRVETEPLGEGSEGAAWNPVAGLTLEQWLAGLGEADRELVLLRYVDGFTYQEIAAMVEAPVGTVQWRVFQLKKRLAEWCR
jgi:RNA polymerase sigma-70 factor (ECF subfamily)